MFKVLAAKQSSKMGHHEVFFLDLASVFWYFSFEININLSGA